MAPPVIRRKKSCPFTAKKVVQIDYKDFRTLSEFVTKITCKIIPARTTGVSHKYQLQLVRAIRRARFLALMPYTDQH